MTRFALAIAPRDGVFAEGQRHRDSRQADQGRAFLEAADLVDGRRALTLGERIA